MDRQASTIFRNLAEAGSKAFKLIRETAISPEKNKTLKEWGITDVAEMVGRTAQTIRNLEDAGKLPKPRLISKGKRDERVYNLTEINQLRDHFQTRPKKPVGSTPAVIGFTNFKGGAGKTISSVCCAQYFAKKGYRVLFIDCDSQASATQLFGYIPDEELDDEHTLLNVLIAEDPVIKKVIRSTYWDGLHLIPANLSLYNAELMIPTQIAEHALKTGQRLEFFRRLKDSLKAVEADYDIIIIDCPPSMGMISINAIFAANALMIEMPPVIVDFASTIQFFKMVSEVTERLPQKEYAFIRVLLTKYNNRTTAKQLQDLLRGFFGQYIMTNNMIESEAVSKAAANLQTLYEVDKYDNDKKTYMRAIQCANQVNEEVEALVQLMWDKATRTIAITEEDIVK